MGNMPEILTLYFCILDSSSSVCRDFIRNVCKRGTKCRFSHVLPDSEDAPQDKRQRQHIESNSGYIKNDASCIGGNRPEQKESMLKDKHSGGLPMQLKVCFSNTFHFNVLNLQLEISINGVEVL